MPRAVLVKRFKASAKSGARSWRAALELRPGFCLLPAFLRVCPALRGLRGFDPPYAAYRSDTEQNATTNGWATTLVTTFLDRADGVNRSRIGRSRAF